ncbi:MAG: hypothetical protein KA299_11890, partial [Fusobacteriaceae bacterium]|nr:hypothetical protein [Fusobacteriaceae bacterium]MBU9919417.1 hypothetical protein [Fusobacteriaceae bacterium]
RKKAIINIHTSSMAGKPDKIKKMKFLFFLIFSLQFGHWKHLIKDPEDDLLKIIHLIGIDFFPQLGHCFIT